MNVNANLTNTAPVENTGTAHNHQGTADINNNSTNNNIINAQAGGAKEAPLLVSTEHDANTKSTGIQAKTFTADAREETGPKEDEKEPTPQEQSIANDKEQEPQDGACTKAVVASHGKTSSKDPVTSATQALRAIWNMMEEQKQEGSGNGNAKAVTAAVTQAIQVLMQTYDEGILQPAIRAMMELEKSKKYARTLEQALTSKEREMERLQQSDQQSKKSIANLLKAVETSNEESRENAQSKLVEAKLRADFSHAIALRNEAQQTADEYKTRVELLKNDLDHYKEKSNKLQTTKAQLERDLHTTRGMLNSMQGTVSNDVDYHKRKLDEANLYLKSTQAVVVKKDREIDSLRKERDRLLTQNRMAQLKQNGGDGGFGFNSNKKSRKSF